jgi:hypothetical protein
VSKRHGRVAPPPRPGGWDFRYASKATAEGWEKLCAAAPSNSRIAWERITTDPRQRDTRQHPLKGTLGSRVVNGEPLEQWQFEVTGAGRLWYCIDDARRIVWLMEAATGHPKSTD